MHANTGCHRCAPTPALTFVRAVLLVALVAGCVLMTGCRYALAWMWTPPKLDMDIAYARTPTEDVQLVNEIFENIGGSPWGGTQSLRWVETDVYRIFQCDEHYVIVYPPDFTAREASIMLVPGQMPALPAKGREIRRDDFIRSVAQRETQWTQHESLRERGVGTRDWTLGMSLDEMRQAVQDSGYSYGHVDHTASWEEIAGAVYPALNGSWSPGTMRNGRMYRPSRFTYEYYQCNGHLFRLHIYEYGMTALNQLQLSSHQTVWVAEGTIDLDAIEVED